MTGRVLATLLGGVVCVTGGALAWAGMDAPMRPVAIDQNVDQPTLQRYHHTDQGTRLLPAAWMAALKTADGSMPVMDPANTARFGFLPGAEPRSKLNPFGWSLGFTVSDPATSNGVSVMGITCAACHTGQIEYRGHAVRIEGGQSMVDLAGFEAAVLKALAVVTQDPARKVAFYKDAIAAGYPAVRMAADFERFSASSTEMLHGQAALTANQPGPGRVDAVQGIADALLRHDLGVPGNKRSYDAPVSYPYLWDIWRLSWLQYNGFLPPLAQSRNIGEVLGTSGQTNLINAAGTLNPEPQRWRTSVRLDNLIWMESVLKRLSPPPWPAAVLGPINRAQAAQGRTLFAAHCAGCHGVKQLPNGNWDVSIVALTHVGTDPKQATNWSGHTYDATKLGLGPAVNATSAATIVNAVRNQYYADYNTPAAEREGDVSFGAPCGYKARPLVGVWATPPFLHNGSVRTIYDLLSDTRPGSFGVGTRSFDPVKLGYLDDTAPGAFRLDTSLVGNSNVGHWWTDDVSRPGRIGRKLSEPEKMMLIEYLKAATYADYPTQTVAKMQPLPCDDNSGWAIAQNR